MLNLIYRSLTAGLLPLIRVTPPAEYGIGFDLSLDYG